MLQTASVHWQLVAIDILWIRFWRGWRGQRLARQHSVTLLLQSRRFRIAHANGCCKQASACWSMTSSAIRPIWIVSFLVAKLGVSCAKWSFLQWEFGFHKSIIHTYSYFFHACQAMYICQCHHWTLELHPAISKPSMLPNLQKLQWISWNIQQQDR